MGSFWVFGSLEVSDDLKGPWKAIGHSQKPGAEISVTIPASLSLGGLNADFTPFRPFLQSMAWGRLVLSSGESAVIDLKELRD